MQGRVIYFKDADASDTIVRKRPEVRELEYISRERPVWTKTKPNSAYEREFYLGEGNNCLFDITYEEAKRRLEEWGINIYE